MDEITMWYLWTGERLRIICGKYLLSTPQFHPPIISTFGKFIATSYCIKEWYDWTRKLQRSTSDIKKMTDHLTPATVEEITKLAARREQSNKLWDLMEKYISKGYRMVDKRCVICSNILLQPPIGHLGKHYCVNCNDTERTENNTNGKESSHRTLMVTVPVTVTRDKLAAKTKNPICKKPSIREKSETIKKRIKKKLKKKIKKEIKKKIKKKIEKEINKTQDKALDKPVIDENYGGKDQEKPGANEDCDEH